VTAVARLAYLGSPSAAVAPLEALVAAGHDIALVVSRADTRRGRGGELSPSPVKKAALDLGLPVSDALDDVVAAGAELAVVVAYGRIVPQRVLDVVPMINVHFSLLPRWRGAAPVERAILAGDDVTGVCVMRLEAGLDTGPVLATTRLAIGPDEHSSALMTRLSEAGAALLVDVLAGGVAALGDGQVQEGEPTYAAKLDPEEFRLDWTLPAVELQRVIRLDRAWTTFRGERLRVLAAGLLTDDTDDTGGTGEADTVAPPGSIDDNGGDLVVRCGSGSLALREVQPAGKRPMAAADWRRGVRAVPGEFRGTQTADR
jgi:methionyl-tRNA formyltransferase